MGLNILRGDITKMETDAIVNAANSRLAPGGGVCGAIFAAAGYEALDRACKGIGGCETGDAVLTPGFALAEKYVIHAVGPVWRGGGYKEAELLESCYWNTLLLAEKHGCRSISFPVISAGIYGYPKQEALKIAIQTILKFLKARDMDVNLTVFDAQMFVLAHDVLQEAS